MAVDFASAALLSEGKLSGRKHLFACVQHMTHHVVAAPKRIYEGKWYYFCSMACRQKFVALPYQSIAKAAASERTRGNV